MPLLKGTGSSSIQKIVRKKNKKMKRPPAHHLKQLWSTLSKTHKKEKIPHHTTPKIKLNYHESDESISYASDISSQVSTSSCDATASISSDKLNITVGLNCSQADGVELLASKASLPVAIDCEFCGVGERKSNGLGRVSIVDYDGNVLYDVISQPEEPITDYRTPWSGIRPEDMHRAIPFECIQDQVRRLIKHRVVVGHMINNDFGALRICHNKDMVRDTAKSPYLKMLADLPVSKAPVSLRRLTSILLGRNIQTGEHCSVEDARATMELYRLVEEDWDKDLLVARQSQELRPSTAKDKSKRGKNYISTEDESSVKSLLHDDFWCSDSLEK